MMGRRHLVIERSSPSSNPAAPVLQVLVDDRAEIGPWVATLAARLGYPLVDSFGSPLAYRLRSKDGAQILPTTGRFAEVAFLSGGHFILEPDRHRTMPMGTHAGEARRSSPPPTIAQGFSRRALLRLLATFSGLGLGSGMTTAVAQHLLTQQPPPAITSIAVQTLFRHHPHPVGALTWSPDGRLVASGSDDGSVLVWNVQGQVLYKQQFPASVRALAWSPDGVYLLAGTGTTVSFLNARTGNVLAEHATAHTAAITAVGWTQAAIPLALSAGRDTTAIVWHAPSQKPLVVFRGHTSAIEALAVLGTTVVTASSGGVARVWSALTAQEIHGYYAETQHPLSAAAFSSQGRLAIGGDDGLLALWPDGRICQRQMQDAFGVHCLDEAQDLKGHIQPVRAIAFAPDGRWLASSGEDKQLIIWSMQTSQPLLIQRQQEVPIALSWSPSAPLLAGALGPCVALWHLHL